MDIKVSNGTLLVNGSCLERPDHEVLIKVFWLVWPAIHSELAITKEVRLAWWGYNLRAPLAPAGLKRVGTSWQDARGHDMCQPLRGLASFLRSISLRAGLDYAPAGSDIKEGFYFCVKTRH